MKTIKIIDLLNKIANGEEVPKMVTANKFEDFEDMIFIYDKDIQDYKSKDCDYLFEMIFNRGFPILNKEVEILDEEDEFEDIENIEEISINKVNDNSIYDNECLYVKTINQLIKNQKKIIERLKEEGK